MCVSKFVRVSNQLSSIAIIIFFNNAAFREDNFESLTLFNFFLLLTWVQDHVFDLILRNFKISKVLFFCSNSIQPVKVTLNKKRKIIREKFDWVFYWPNLYIVNF